MQIAVISDTHMPRGGRGLPSGCVERLRAAELILHAGDFVELSVLAELRSHERSAEGFQIFNPGSPTERRQAPERAMGIAHIAGGRVRFELVSLG